MGVFGAIVLSEAPIVRAGEAQLPESRAVGAQLVGDEQLRCEALFVEQLPAVSTTASVKARSS
jgi:hypothetical protein